MDEAPPIREPDAWPLRLVRWPLDLAADALPRHPPGDRRLLRRSLRPARGRHRLPRAVLPRPAPRSSSSPSSGSCSANESLRLDVIEQIVDRFPLSESGGADVTREIEKLASPATALGLVSLLVFGWAATGMMAALRAGLEVAMRVRTRTPGSAREAGRRDPHRRGGRARARRRLPEPRAGRRVRLDPAAARRARARRWPSRAGHPPRSPAGRHHGRRVAPLPLRPGPTPPHR